MSCNERGRIKLGICVADFVCFIQKPPRGVLDLDLYGGVPMKKSFLPKS